MFDEKDLVLDARHVTRRFPAAGGRELVACNDVNLKMYRGKTLGLVGESGCGKSTFMRFLVWLDKPTEGEIWFRGKDITKLKGKELWENRQHIQMVFQDPSTSFNPKMKIRDIVCEPLLNFKRIRPSEKDAKARELLEMVELPGDFADRYPHNMSGGQRQRVAIARALASDPEVLLCDEATSALDPMTTQSILTLLQDINQRLGITVVLITHEMAVIRQICNRVAILDGGRIAEEGTVDDVFVHTRSAAGKRLFGILSSDEEDTVADVPALRVVFDGGKEGMPIIAGLVKSCGVDVNILSADIKPINGKPYGQMLIESPDDPLVRLQVIQYLTDQGLTVKEVRQ